LAAKNLKEIGIPCVRLCANIQPKMLLYFGHTYNNDWSNSLHLTAFNCFQEWRNAKKAK